MNNEALYVIPARYRKMENMHIIFWLLKDVSWCMLWKTLGMVMVVPTLLISILITWRNRHIRSERAHNMAITFWISANAYWMISEFFGFDEQRVWGGFEARYYAVIPFAIGVVILAWHYLFERDKEEVKLQPQGA